MEKGDYKRTKDGRHSGIVRYVKDDAVVLLEEGMSCYFCHRSMIEGENDFMEIPLPCKIGQSFYYQGEKAVLKKIIFGKEIMYQSGTDNGTVYIG